jgi:hypothetical protein
MKQVLPPGLLGAKRQYRVSLKGGAVKGWAAQSSIRVRAVLVPNGKSGNKNNLAIQSLYGTRRRCYLAPLALPKGSEHFHYQVGPKEKACSETNQSNDLSFRV